MSKSYVVPAREAKNRFGELLIAAQRRPVKITKNGRHVATLTAHVDPVRFKEAEDQLWLERAERAMAEGDFLGPEASEHYLKKVLGSSYARTRSRKARTKVSSKPASKARTSSR